MKHKDIAALLLLSPVALLGIVAAALLAPAAIGTSYKTFRITSVNMEPSVLAGDRLMVELLSYFEPRRGDIVVFESIEEPNLTILSRVVAAPGDTVGMTDGKLYLNEHQPSSSTSGSSPGRSDDSPKLLERMARWQQPFLLRQRNPYTPDKHNWGPLVVPRGAYFVLGDNSDLSYDSRYWGLVPANRIRGRPRYVYYSYDPQSYRVIPWLLAIRWARIGHRVD